MPQRPLANSLQGLLAAQLMALTAHVHKQARWHAHRCARLHTAGAPEKERKKRTANPGVRIHVSVELVRGCPLRTSHRTLLYVREHS